jgi:N-acetylglutamate synthase-like GNAT family acetyltransferase
MIFEHPEYGYVIDTNPARLNIDTICSFLSRSYWAATRPRDQIEKSIAHSHPFGMYDGERQIGFARMVSDLTTFAYLADVFIDEEYRGRNLGKWLVGTILNRSDFASMRRLMLATRDAHGLYAQFGFTPLEAPERWMEIYRG